MKTAKYDIWTIRMDTYDVQVPLTPILPGGQYVVDSVRPQSICVTSSDCIHHLDPDRYGQI